MLFSLLLREGNVHIPSVARTQILAYIDASDFRGQVQLSMRHRKKHYTSLINVRILINAYYLDARRFCTNRMWLQMVALMTLLTLLAERIGVLVKSNCYRGTHKALQWKNVEVLVFPHGDSPLRPDVAICVTSHLLKGERGVESYSKTVTLFPEYRLEHAYCPVVPFLVLGLLNHVWEGVESVEDIVSPRVPPRLTHVLRVCAAKCNLPMPRAEVRTERGWAASEAKAMNYGDAYHHLRFFSCLNGFPGESLLYQ